MQPWTTPDIRRPFRWVNGPFSEMAAIIKKIHQERADCILIAPDWPKDWVAAMRSLPVKAAVKLRSYAGICIPGPRVDPTARQTGKPNYALKAYLILWDTTSRS